VHSFGGHRFSLYPLGPVARPAARRRLAWHVEARDPRRTWVPPAGSYCQEELFRIDSGATKPRIRAATWWLDDRGRCRRRSWRGLTGEDRFGDTTVATRPLDWNPPMMKTMSNPGEEILVPRRLMCRQLQGIQQRSQDFLVRPRPSNRTMVDWLANLHPTRRHDRPLSLIKCKASGVPF
jgi:hypothetical protein